MHSIKARLTEFIRNPHTKDILLGGVVGAAATYGTLYAMKANFSDPENTLHIPDSIVDGILAGGLPVMITRNDGAQLMIGPS